jgi:hypothetical protein
MTLTSPLVRAIIVVVVLVVVLSAVILVLGLVPMNGSGAVTYQPTPAAT